MQLLYDAVLAATICVTMLLLGASVVLARPARKPVDWATDKRTEWLWDDDWCQPSHCKVVREADEEGAT